MGHVGSRQLDPINRNILVWTEYWNDSVPGDLSHLSGFTVFMVFKVLTLQVVDYYGSFTYYLGFSLALTYSHTVGNITQEKTDVYTFSQLSTSTSFYIKMNSDYTDGTNISACLEVLEQCGQVLYPSDTFIICTLYSAGMLLL